VSARQAAASAGDAAEGCHSRLYAEPRLYDLAFSYRDVAAECDFLQALGPRLAGRLSASVVELAAGPSSHAIELSRRGLRAVALDREPAMVAYARDKAAAAGIAIDCRAGDMTGFALDEPVDLALLLLGSAGCLLTNDAAVACFRSVAAALRPGGLFVLELAHPAEVFGLAETTSRTWEVSAGDTRIRVRWGAADDVFDPVSQLAEVTATLTVWQRGRKRVIRDKAPQRRFTVQEIELLARLSGGLVPVAWHGAMNAAIALDDLATAWRLVAVLKRL
jgi:SAM-dependent methyltransferase